MDSIQAAKLSLTYFDGYKTYILIRTKVSRESLENRDKSLGNALLAYTLAFGTISDDAYSLSC